MSEKKAGNPLWQPGGKSPNPEGRRKQTAASRSIKGAIDRFLKSKMKAKELEKLYKELPATGKLEMIATLMPYRFPRLSAMSVKAEINSMDPETIDELYKRITGATEDTTFTELLQLPEPLKQPA
jgi:hypothetical protein